MTYASFYPELLAIASSCEKMRGLFYRHGIPDHHDEHHYFLSMNQHNGAQIHLEWRLGEADYGNTDYFAGQVFLYAALTSAMAIPEIFNALKAVAATQKFFPSKVIDSQDAKVSDILGHFNQARFDALRKVVLDCSHLSVMPWGRGLVDQMFEQTISWMK